MPRTCLMWLCLLLALPAIAQDKNEPSTVFDMPRLRSEARQRTRVVAALLKAGRPKEAEKHARRVVALMPENASAQYNLACALAQQGQKEEAFTWLSTAVELGFTRVEHMQQDPDLKPLRGDGRFAELVERARVVADKPPMQQQDEATPAPVKNGRKPGCPA